MFFTFIYDCVSLLAVLCFQSHFRLSEVKSASGECQIFSTFSCILFLLILQIYFFIIFLFIYSTFWFLYLFYLISCCRILSTHINDSWKQFQYYHYNLHIFFPQFFSASLSCTKIVTNIYEYSGIRTTVLRVLCIQLNNIECTRCIKVRFVTFMANKNQNQKEKEKYKFSLLCCYKYYL